MSLTLTLSKVIFCPVCGLYYLLIYTISVCILCVSQKGCSRFESNQQVYDFYKSVIFEKHWHCNLCISKLFIHCNASSCCVQVTGDATISLYMWVRLFAPVSSVFLSMCDIEYESTSKKPCHLCQNLSKFDSLLHKTHSMKVSRHCQYQSFTSLVHNIIKQINMLDLVWSHIQPKKQNLKNEGAK